MKIRNVFLFMVVAMAAGSIIAGCTRKSGVTVGSLVDAQIDGRIFQSCEIDIQYGNDSSRMEPFSSRDLALCDELQKHIGKKVRVFYHWENFSVDTLDAHLIDKVEVVQ